jgi:hypothetical protein
VDGLNIGPEDVLLEHETFGAPVEAIRGKSVRVNRKQIKYEGRPHGKIIDADVNAYVDIMFVSGLAFLISYIKPLMGLLCTLIKSRKVQDVAAAIGGHKGKLKSLGFNVTRVVSDGEGAIGAIKEELEAQGCAVDIHSTQTFTAEVDPKIKQIKNVMRSIIVGLPYALSMSLLVVKVFS